MLSEDNNKHTDNEGNKYYLLVSNDKNTTWTAIKQPFLIVTDVVGSITGQFVSSSSYNEPLPNTYHQIVIVKIKGINVAEMMPTLLSDMNKIIQEDRVDDNPYIIIHHVLTESKLDEIFHRLSDGRKEIATESYMITIRNVDFFMNILCRKIEKNFCTSMYCPGFVLYI